MPTRAASNRPRFALAADSDFPGGNGVAFERLGPDRLQFQMLKHASPAVLWWYFRARVPVDRRVCFELVNTADTLGRPSSWAVVRPVYSYDQIHWQRLAACDCQFDAKRGRFVFAGVFKQATVYLAQAYPYQQAELDRLQARLSESSLFRPGFAGRTEQGRPYPLWTLAPPKKTRGEKAPPLGVFLSARLHAGESHGSVALDGMLTEIAFGRSAPMHWLRRQVRFLIAPMVDYDGVTAGMFGKDRAPIDFNRDWSASPLRPEIRRLQKEVAGWARRVKFAVYFDFHCPCLPDIPHLYGAVPGMATARLKAGEKQFAAALEKHSPRGARFFRRDLHHPGYQGPTYEVVAVRYMTAVHGVLGLTPEIAYHPTRRSARDEARTGPLVDLPSLRKLGAAHAHALAAVLQKNEAGIRAGARPFFDPAEPILGPLVARAGSPFHRWGLMGGAPQQFGERILRPGDGPAHGSVPALTVKTAMGEPCFFVTEPVSPGRPGDWTGLTGFWVRGRGLRAPKRNAAGSQPGMAVHVFYYDRHGARFGRLYGSELREVAVTNDWRRFVPALPPPPGAVSVRLAVRCEMAHGAVEFTRLR